MGNRKFLTLSDIVNCTNFFESDDYDVFADIIEHPPNKVDIVSDILHYM